LRIQFYTNKYFSRKYPDISFIHTHPGVVNTGIAKELPWYAKYPAIALGKLMATDPEKVGERLFFAGYSSPDFAKGAHLLNSSLHDVSQNAVDRHYVNEELQDLVWKHTEDIFNKGLSAK
jgi:hypothetical protein